MSLPWPKDLCAGTVVWRLAGMKADNYDPDRDPQLIAGEGIEVTFSPDVSTIVGYRGVEGKMSIMPFISSGVIDSQGYLCTKQEDGSAGDRGVVLPATDCETITPRDWTYTVTITDNRVRVDRFSVQVVSDETVDLYDFVKVGSSGGTKIISEVQTAERAEKAAGDAEEYRNTTKGYRDETLAARDLVLPARDETLTARDQTLAHGITVDTSVGTRVFVGDTLMFYDTGWRDVTAEATVTILSGRILIKRTATEVYIVVDDVIVDGSGTNTYFRLPSGFRPAYRAQGYWNEAINRPPLGDYMVNTAGYVVFYRVPNDTTTPTNLTVGIPASSTLPTSLPGTPA